MILPQIPHYHVSRKIDAGGTAEVFLGVDLRSGFPVAIKQLYKSHIGNSFVLQKFKEEATHYLYLNHPNITRLVDFVEMPNAFFLIMEFIEGKNLENYISTVTGPMSEEHLVPMFLQLLDTIGYLHRNNILHLDIKPSNIMITPNGYIKLLDMGISSKFSDTKKIDKIAGSPAYMSPEQIKRHNIDKHSDIFSLGITLFAMVTANLPFYSENGRKALFNKILYSPLPSITSFYPGANFKFQAILERATHKNAHSRYQNCEAFSNDIKNAFNNL